MKYNLPAQYVKVVFAGLIVMMINSCITSNVSQPIATAPSGVAEADFVVPLNLSLKLSQIQNSPDFT
ncbi:MAG: hypothetical protein K2P92_03485, partial [Bdellovibrionaceae bacterium]|nr:hypothetical protein [Pseudobdellovibrionaceae bacterium]